MCRVEWMQSYRNVVGDGVHRCRGTEMIAIRAPALHRVTEDDT